jgi:hypothetical protein
MLKTADSRHRLTLKDRLAQHSVEAAIVLVAFFVIFRIIVPQTRGQQIAEGELQVIRLLRELHKTQVEVAATGGERLLFLDELVRRSDPGSLLREAQSVSAPSAPDVDLLLLDGYYVALNLTDSGRDDDRAWSRSLATSDDVGRQGYSAFAWPAEYGPATQWVYFVDQRGKLIGSWNHNVVFDGLNEPFPPEAHPLRDYLAAEKEGEDAEWFQFKSMPEVRFPEP